MIPRPSGVSVRIRPLYMSNIAVFGIAFAVRDGDDVCSVSLMMAKWRFVFAITRF